MNKYYPYLFSPISIKGKIAKNRISCSPQSIAGSHDENGYLTQRGFDYYLEKAKGGAGIVTIGETQVLSDFFQKPTEQEMTKYHLLADMIKNYGALVSLEIGHRGQEDYVFEKGAHVEGPSGGIKEPFGVIIDEIDYKRMIELSDAYANACQVLVDCGFDMAMIHGGHSWLLAQFLSPIFNKRTDEYGGSLENRARFPLMVLKKIRERVGNKLLVDFRISAEEVIDNGLHIDEAVAFCKMIEPYVDVIHTSVGTHLDPWCYTFTSIYHKNGINLPLSRKIKEAVSIPVVAIGGFNNPELMESAIEAGDADIICLGRQMLADPYFPNKAETGKYYEINTCIRCMCCHSAPPPPTYCDCTVNPMGGKEFLKKGTMNRLNSSVVVIGGGVAGMTAANRAYDLGANVTLIEKTGRLGGVLNFTDIDAYKGDLRRLKDNIVERSLKRGYKVLLNTEATKKVIEDINPDYIISAVGASPLVIPLKGIEKAEHAISAYYKTDEELGKEIVIIGGGLVGCELAMHLSTLNKKITIIEMADQLAKDAYRMHRGWLLQRLELVASLETGCKCEEITEDGVYALKTNGEKVFFHADSVFFALGMKKNSLPEEIEEIPVKGLVKIGDCKNVSKVKDAIYNGYFAVEHLD